MDAFRGKMTYGDKTVWAAEYQSSGRGQKGNVWKSQRSENLTFSILLKPSFLLASDQFLISEIASVAVVDYLKTHGISARIKWPNDIYVSDRKLSGMLLEHTVSGDKVSASIVGIGINVHQCRFDSDIPNPVSMKQCLEEMGRYDCPLDLKSELDSFLSIFFKLYGSLDSAPFRQDIHNLYIENLYRKNEWHSYLVKTPDGLAVLERIEACIAGVDRKTSRLQVITRDGRERSFAFKEVSYII
ncbi:MAG: biotin--[acetyl-CoA-carboxylase] ligase [Alistipes sp.]|nr:biotin--[acetyl-CoA-carboxylase] ligase [Candidatus Minthomonas equi]